MAAPAAPAALPILEARGLVKAFPRVKALDGIGFTLSPADRLTALIGPDGAGKSTLLTALCGLLTPDAGELSVLGMTPDPNDAAFALSVAFMPQRFGLYTELSCMENLLFFGRMKGVPGGEIKTLAREMLSATGLAPFEARPAGKLSGGMKQKLSLAVALLTAPRLLILDEPTFGVDPLSRRELWATIRRMMAEHDMRSIFSTAYLEEAERADRVLLMEAGKLEMNATPAEALANMRGRTFLAHPEASSVPQSAPGLHAQWRAMRDVRAVSPASPWLDVRPQAGALLKVTADGAVLTTDELARLTPRAPQLEDAYAARTIEAAGPEAPGALPTAEPAPEPAIEPVTDISPDASDVVIRVAGLERRFGNFVAVADTTFDVRRGEIFGLLGPNGAGKTTTFRMLCGLLPPSSGEVEVLGMNMRNAKAEIRARIGYVAQKFSLYEKLTVRQNLLFFGQSYGLAGARLDAAYAKSLQDFELTPWEEIFAKDLPEGARRQLAMACGLIHGPDILFLDEATSGADLSARRAFWRRMSALAEAGTTIIVTTHFMDEAEYCSRFLIQDVGEVLVLGTPDEVRGRRSMEEAFIAIVEEGRRRPGETVETPSAPASPEVQTPSAPTSSPKEDRA